MSRLKIDLRAASGSKPLATLLGCHGMTGYNLSRRKAQKA